MPRRRQASATETKVMGSLLSGRAPYTTESSCWERSQEHSTEDSQEFSQHERRPARLQLLGAALWGRVPGVCLGKSGCATSELSRISRGDDDGNRTPNID